MPFSPLLVIFVIVSLLHGSPAAIAQQEERITFRTPWTTELQPQWLHDVMPGAASFSEKAGEPPVFKAFRENAGEQELIGYVFVSADVPPLEKGYSNPIDMLIGMDTDGNLTGLKVLDYHESYRYSRGDFVAEPEFQRQFPGKSISDEFRIASDIDGLAGATMTSFGIARGTREAARRVAAAYMGYQEGDVSERASAENARRQLELLDWEQLLTLGIVKQLRIPMLTGTELELTITYIGREVLGQYFIGEKAYTRAERDASIRLGGREMILLAVGGSAATQFRQNLISIQQGDGPIERVQPRRFVTAGNADEGAIAGKANYAGAIVLEEGFDVTQPFSVYYRPQGSPDDVGVEYVLSGLGLALARNEHIPSQEDIAAAELAQKPWPVRFWYAPPWGETRWSETLLLTGILLLSTLAFLRNSAALRWTALTATLLYLGFIKGGFLSVSHLTGALAQGPGIFVSNLSTLMIVAFTLISTLLVGRLFCSSLCPFGAVQDIIARLRPKRWQLKVPQRIHDNALYIKYGILVLIVVMALIDSNISIFQYFEPFGTLFFFSSSVALWGILLVILVGCAVVERFYCRYVCPLGAALGVISLVSPFRIKRVPQCTVCKVCEHACPTGAIRGPQIDFKECVRCDVCEIKLEKKAGSCRHDMAEITRRQLGRNHIPVVEIGAQIG